MVIEDKCATHERHDYAIANMSLSGPCEAVPDYPVIPERLSLPDYPFWVFDAAQYCEPGYCTGDDELSRSVLAQSRWEGFETSLVLDILTDTNRAWVLDIGSHVGWYSTIAARLGHNVLAFDADREHLHLLRMNTRGDNYALPVESIHCWIDADTPKMTSPPRGHIRLVKIDLEGSERHAIRMIEPMLHRVDYVLMEVSPEFDQGDVITPLAEYGFEAFIVPTKGYEGPFSEPRLETGQYPLRSIGPVQRSVLFARTS